MIKSIKFSNFYSFCGETELSFIVNKKPSLTDYDVISNNERVNKVIAIIGPNGAGKTQLLRPLSFIKWFFLESFTDLKPEDNIPYECHSLNEKSPSVFEILFVIDGVDYKYKLELNGNEVEREELYKKTSRLYSYIFKREKESGKYRVKTRDLGIDTKILESVKKNCSLISALYNFNVEQVADILSYFSALNSNVNHIGRRSYHDAALLEAAEFFIEHEESFLVAKDIMCQLDLGLDNLKIESFKNMDKDGDEDEVFIPFGLHKNEDDLSFTLPFFQESSGTKSAFVLLRQIIPVLMSGGLAIVDELDNDLHPHMLPFFIDLFKSKELNEKDAQLIFSCHTPEVLNILQKHQIYLTEKDNLESDAWRLDEVGNIRSDDNLYAKYQAGALDAIPNI